MKKLLTLLAVTLLLVACKKDEQIEKNLWKGDGIWNITSYTSSETSTPSSQSDFTYTANNAGSITFKKDGTGIFKYVDGGDVELASFNYSNTTETLTMIIDSEARIFNMDWKKNKMTLTIAQNYSSNGTSYDYKEIIDLSKQ